MVKVTPEEFAEKWGRRLKGATEDIRRGIDRVVEAPSKKAVEKKAKWVARMTDTTIHDKWADRLEKVTLEDWKNKFLTKGVPRIPTGVDGAIDKMEDFGKQLLPHVEAGQKIVVGMPDITLEDSLARVEAFIRHMAKFRKK